MESLQGSRAGLSAATTTPDGQCGCVTLPDSCRAVGYMQHSAARHGLLEKQGTTSLTSHSVPPLPRGYSVGGNLGNRELLGLEDGPVGMRLKNRESMGLGCLYQNHHSHLTFSSPFHPSCKYPSRVLCT